MEFWTAQTDAGRYRLESFGETEEEAITALQAGIESHAARQWPHDIESRKAYVRQMNDDLYCESRKMGAAYRDGSQV